MIYPTKPFYVICGFSPPAKGYEMGGYGFSIGLQASFAKRCIKFKINQEKVSRMNEIGEAMLSRVFNSKSFNPPFHFKDMDDEYTMMLGFVQVMGNACDIGTSGVSCKDIMEMPDDALVEYHPHNVDSVAQAYTLLSLWLQWYSMAFSLVMDKSEL